MARTFSVQRRGAPRDRPASAVEDSVYSERLFFLENVFESLRITGIEIGGSGSSRGGADDRLEGKSNRFRTQCFHDVD